MISRDSFQNSRIHTDACVNFALLTCLHILGAYHLEAPFRLLPTYVCSGSIVVTTLDCGPGGSWFESRCGCQYSMRLDRLDRAYPSLHPFGVVHWVPVLLNIETATECESNRQLQLWTVFPGTVVNKYQFQRYSRMGSYVQQDAGLSSSECLKKSFETHPLVAVSQWSISSINQSKLCTSKCRSVLEYVRPRSPDNSRQNDDSAMLTFESIPPPSNQHYWAIMWSISQWLTSCFHAGVLFM